MANIKYNKTIEKTILNRLCNGESIRKICKDPEMVSWATFSQKLTVNGGDKPIQIKWQQ